MHSRICLILFIFFVVSCTSMPRPRKEGSILVISALLPASGPRLYYKAQKLMLLKVKEGEIDSSVIFFTDEVKGDLFYAYNIPPGKYIVAGCVAESSNAENPERLIFVFRYESALRCLVDIQPRSVLFGGRLQFDHLQYDPFISDDFQKRLLKQYNPLIITGDAHTLNAMMYSYSVFMCNTAFLDRSNPAEVYSRIRSDLSESSWVEYLEE